jgi:hypothetical protein
MFSKILIEYADPNNLVNSCSLTFNLRNHNIAKKWANVVSIAIKKYPIDDPGRFYGIGSKEQQISRAVTKINQTINEINAFEPLINRMVTDINDQDTLNYLHHIFEVYHGLLDQQTHEFWQRAPDNIRRALANLNTQVHECEDIGRTNVTNLAHIVTWYRLKKYLTLDDNDYSLFEDVAKKGTIYLHYVEIGKTLEDLSVDNDQYIHDGAFKPFRHYSADFYVKYYDDDELAVKNKLANIKDYYENNKEFFLSKNLQWGHPYLTSGAIPLADLDIVPNDLIDKIEKRQWVKSVILI